MPPKKTATATSTKSEPPIIAPAKKAVTKPKKNGNGTSTHETISQHPETSRPETRVLTMEIDSTVIAERAREIWQSEGCPEGRELDHWLRAERELRSE